MNRRWLSIDLQLIIPGSQSKRLDVLETYRNEFLLQLQSKFVPEFVVIVSWQIKFNGTLCLLRINANSHRFHFNSSLEFVVDVLAMYCEVLLESLRCFKQMPVVQAKVAGKSWMSFLVVSEQSGEVVKHL